jgi:type II secretory pathway pseudopilin PulG
MHDRRSEQGHTLTELMFVAAIAAVVGAIALPPLLTAVDDLRTRAAVRYLTTRLQQARMQAVTRSADTALRFERVGATRRFTQYIDGNGNGVLSRDIASGIDLPVRAGEKLTDRFPRVDFGTLLGLPPVDPGSAPPGDDPVRFGASDMVTFTPLGTATPGSLYVLGPRGLQYVVRVFGTTGKTRVLRFDRRRQRWMPV